MLQELVSASLDDFHPTAIQELADHWLAVFPTPRERDDAAVRLPAVLASRVLVQRVDVPDEDWARRSQEDLRPVRVGRVIVAPPWAAGTAVGTTDGAPPASRREVLHDAREQLLEVLIRPSMGFGTGHHASTRLCLSLLQQIGVAGRTVLDAGTGSGVLALAARALGARSVIAVDDDPDAIESARENLGLNGAAGIDLEVADLRTLACPPADIVTANLTGGLLVRCAVRLTGALVPGGSLILGGVTAEEERDVLSAFVPPLEPVSRAAEDGWVGLLLERKAGG